MSHDNYFFTLRACYEPAFLLSIPLLAPTSGIDAGIQNAPSPCTPSRTLYTFRALLEISLLGGHVKKYTSSLLRWLSLAAVLLTLLTLGAGHPSAAHAQNPLPGSLCRADNTLSYGQGVRGTITGSDLFYVYCFAATQGDWVAFDLTTVEGNLQSAVTVLDPELTGQPGMVLTLEVEAGTENPIYFTVPHDGTYLLFISRTGAVHGETEGTFQVWIDLKGSTPSTNPTSAPVAPSATSTPLAATPQELILGDWTLMVQGLGLMYEFRSDGTFTQLLTMANVDCSGTYFINGNTLTLDFGLVVDMRPGGCMMGSDYATLSFNGDSQFTLTSPDGFAGQGLGLGTYQRN
jgi:hypothetical protein